MRSTLHLGTLAAGLVTAGALVAACETPNTDSFRSDGGASPDPTGIIEGTVLYVGPRPQCVRDEETQEPTAVIGNVILTLFVYDNPPPPTGSASSATSLLTIPGDELFSVRDCMPVDPSAEDRRPITRSASFTWPELALGHGPCASPNVDNPSCDGVDYQIRGFYDSDGDFNPFFSVRNMPTAGDIAGGAFVSTSAVPPQFQRIEFGHTAEQPNGQIVQGIAVTLGAPVSTERPIFEIADSTRALESHATIPPTPDRIQREQLLWEMTRMRVDPIVSLAPGARPSDAWLAALRAGGIDDSNYQFGNPRYGFYIAPVDADLDAMQDLHPVLGTAEVSYYYPVPIVRRARSPMEQRLGVPDVLFVGSIRPTLPAGVPSGIARQTLMSWDAVIPPIAVMITNPALPAVCRAPIIPPGNLAETYERIWVDCQELPTGNYDVNVLSGLAAATFVDENERCMTACMEAGSTEDQCRTQCGLTVPAATENGWVAQGGSYSSQAWSIPNDLGCPDTLYRPTAMNQLDPRGPDGSLPECGAEESLMLSSQSRQGGFAVVDTDDGNSAPDQTQAATPGHGIAACTTATSAADGMPREVTYVPLPNDACCPQQLDAFCGLPLCPLRDASVEVPADPSLGLSAPYAYPEAVVPAQSAASRRTRELRVPGEDYEVVDGRVVPLCTPFLMPAECCALAALCADDPGHERCAGR